MAHNQMGNDNAAQSEGARQQENTSRPPAGPISNTRFTFGNVRIINIPANQNFLNVLNITSDQNGQVSVHTFVTTPHSNIQAELFSFHATEHLTGNELLPSINRSVFNETLAIDNGRHSPLPTTSAMQSDSQNNEDDRWNLRLRPFEEPYSREIFQSESVQVTRLANRLIKLSRYLETPSCYDLSCPSCHLIPNNPVTGSCGHTRCMRCTVAINVCPCGTPTSWVPHENTVAREIIEKMKKLLKFPRSSRTSKLNRSRIESSPTRDSFQLKISQRRIIPRRSASQYTLPRIPMSAYARYTQAQTFMSAGQYMEAAPHLARAAASVEPCSGMARRLLNKSLHIICQERREDSVWRELSSSIREQSMQSWLQPADLECVLCTNPYREPVSVPCGHTFCRPCLDRSLYYSRRCPLCFASLDYFNIHTTRNNIFFSAILQCIDDPPLPLEPDVVPVVISYVAFPGMPCPLFIKNYRHALMVLRILRAGTRRFGMISYERDHPLADYGIILEIRDCVIFEDRQCIVSTIGISRFKVTERDVRNGCDVARITPLVDVTPTKEEVRNIHMLTESVVGKALTWIDGMDVTVRQEIETAFGTWPVWTETYQEWWTTTDGPNWLWWIIAILPLRKEGKVHILSTSSLLTRMLAVLRTFEVMDGSIV